MFWTRLGSGAVLLVVAFLGFFFGSWILPAILFLTALAGYSELIKALGVHPEDKNGFCAPEVIGYVGVFAYYLVLLLNDINVITVNIELALFAILVLFFMAIMFVYVVAYPKYNAEQVGFSVFAFVYAPVMLSFIDMTRGTENGKYVVWIILISSWGCDTCAYVVGKLIGKKKIFPVLSPKKSLEGCFGGVIGAALLGVVYALFVTDRSARSICSYALLCAVGAVMSMVGDLAASAIKRNKGIKDYGKIIPGHGGVMDRFDSVIVTAPMVFFLTVLLSSF